MQIFLLVCWFNLKCSFYRSCDDDFIVNICFWKQTVPFRKLFGVFAFDNCFFLLVQIERYSVPAFSKFLTSESGFWYSQTVCRVIFQLEKWIIANGYLSNLIEFSFDNDLCHFWKLTTFDHRSSAQLLIFLE